MNVNFYAEEFLQYSTIIVANGEFPSHPSSLLLLKNAKKIICCDGAISHLEKLKIVPTIIIGDGDSMSSLQRLKYKKIWMENKNIDYSDLHKSICYCIDAGEKKVAIIGGGGLREDHQLANFSMLLTYGNRIHLIMVTNFGIFTPIFSTATLSSFIGQQISVFNFSKSPLTFEKLKYPVENKSFEYFWEGSLNEALDTNFTIHFLEGKVLVFQVFES